jgi:hypothetical protein
VTWPRIGVSRATALQHVRCRWLRGFPLQRFSDLPRFAVPAQTAGKVRNVRLRPFVTGIDDDAEQLIVSEAEQKLLDGTRRSLQPEGSQRFEDAHVYHQVFSSRGRRLIAKSTN